MNNLSKTSVHKLITMAVVLVAIGALGAGYMGVTAISNKTAADSSSNWYMVNGEAIIGVLTALIALLRIWFAPTTTVVSDPKVFASSSQEDTVEILVQKLEHRCRMDAANSILNLNGTSWTGVTK